MITIRELRLIDEQLFLTAMQRSTALHFPWIKAPLNTEEFESFFARFQLPNSKSFLAFNDQDQLIGVFNLSEIVRGAFQSAYLGFYAVIDYAGMGYMSTALKCVLQEVFDVMQLHRIEANIQPDNQRSIQLVKNNGFRLEGYSPRYLNINGQWCDHERWALTVEDFQGDTDKYTFCEKG